MGDTERDRTDDWVVPAGTAPPLLGELELKVDEALAIARSSEDAVSVVGAAALDAAEQARRAAALAESASEIALEATRRPEVPRAAMVNGSPEAAAHAGPVAEDSLERFVERADLLTARLRAV